MERASQGGLLGQIGRLNGQCLDRRLPVEYHFTGFFQEDLQQLVVVFRAAFFDGGGGHHGGKYRRG